MCRYLFLIYFVVSSTKQHSLLFLRQDDSAATDGFHYLLPMFLGFFAILSMTAVAAIPMPLLAISATVATCFAASAVLARGAHKGDAAPLARVSELAKLGSDSIKAILTLRPRKFTGR